MLALRGSRCLVTGGAGFIGSHLTERLVALGHSVRVVDNLSTAMKRISPQSLARSTFCLAISAIQTFAPGPSPGSTSSSTSRRCRACPGRSRTRGPRTTPTSMPRCASWRRAARPGRPRRLLQLQLGVRGTPVLPKTETVEPLPRSPYATSKLAGEQYVLAFARADLIAGVALRYFNVFGPRQSPHSAYAAVIPNFFQAVLEGRPAILYGDGEQTRDFTYVDNVVDANILAASPRPQRSAGGSPTSERGPDLVGGPPRHDRRDNRHQADFLRQPARSGMCATRWQAWIAPRCSSITVRVSHWRKVCDAHGPGS